jgi:hypothetical protein
MSPIKKLTNRGNRRTLASLLPPFHSERYWITLSDLMQYLEKSNSKFDSPSILCLAAKLINMTFITDFAAKQS